MSKSDPQYTLLDQFLDQPYSLAGRLIDPVSGMLSWQGKREHLRRKELEVLALLASAEGKQVSRENFIAVVWQGNDLVGDRGLTNTIVFLRRSLRDEDADQPLIRTIPRRGYQLAVSVQSVAQRGEEVEPELVPGGAIPECPGWRLLRRLSKSAISDLWLAEPSEFGEREQALRVFRFCRSEAHLQRLRREVTLLRYLTQTLSERNDIVLIRDWQLDEPPYYLACDYANAGSLHDCIQAGVLPREPEKRLALMQGLSDALAAVHALGVVHRQLSAHTVLVNQGDTGPKLLLSAFDLGALSDRSKLAPLGITAAGLTLGSEDASAALTPAEDVYALGVVFLRLALGDAQAQPTPEHLGQVADAPLRALLERCFDPAEKRPSAKELALQLARMNAPQDAALDQNPVTATPAIEVPATPIPLNRMPETIGNYRLLDRLGEGGMGSVYLAESREPVQRQVALKLIKAGMDTAQVLARFEAERQALALMNHVNVAAVFEAGSSAVGRPYFAMEYVPGLEITTHCDQRELDFRARLELFLQVCDGVLHAHQKGIIHRDLKPSNILVKSAQGQPATAKIIDFGVAKSLQRKLGSFTAHTQLGSFVGTPVYSSPEQISGSAGDMVDTRADIYSLGVVLYELLAGVTPYNAEVLASKSPIELTQLLSTQEPPALLKRFVSLEAKDEADIAQRRKMSVVQMKQTLGSDLSWIVAKCLERDPNERYASVLELQKDLRRWLENRPVEARPIRWTYRVGKMARRNWGAVTLGSAVALALIITSTGAIVGFVRSERALRDAERAAEFQVKQLQAIDPSGMGLGFREKLLDQIKNRDIEQGLDETAIQRRQSQLKHLFEGVNFTDLSLEQLDTYYIKPAMTAIEDFDDTPLLQAKLWSGVSEILSTFGRYQSALEVQERALAQQQRLLGSEALPSIQSLRARGLVFNSLRRSAEAERDLRAAAAAASNLLGPSHLETLQAVSALGQVLSDQGKKDESIQLLRPAFEKCRESLGDDHPETLRTMGNLARASFSMGKTDEALTLERKRVEKYRHLFGASHRKTISAISSLVVMLFASNQLKEAELYQAQVLRQNRITLGDRHPLTGLAMSNFAGTVLRLGRFQEAEMLQREALGYAIELLGPNDHMSLIYQSNLAHILFMQRRLKEAEQLLRDNLQVRKRISGVTHRHTLNIIEELGQILVAAEKFDEGIDLLQRFLEWRKKTLNSEAPESLEAARYLALALLQARRFGEAEKLLIQTLGMQVRVLGAGDSKTLETLSDFAWLLGMTKRETEAEVKLREVLAAQRSLKTEDKLPMYISIGRLVELLRNQGRFEEAFNLGQEMITPEERVRNNNYEFGLLQLNHAHTLAKLAKYQDAEKTYLAAYANISRWSEDARPSLKELSKGMLDLYVAWNAAEPSVDVGSRIENWRAKLALVTL